MRGLLVIGAGGHGRVVADAALTTGLWDRICFVDDQATTREVLGCVVVGTSADLESLRGSFDATVVGIGDVHTRLRLLARCEAIGFELPSVIHRKAVVSRFASLGAGCVVFAQSAINPGAVLGKGCIVNTGATIDHDCELGEGVHVCPGAHLAGTVRVGDRTWIGIGACIRHGIGIGSDVTIGAGAAVISDIGSRLTVMGVPARPR